MKVNTNDMRNKILRTIHNYPKAADDDKLLIAIIWKEEGWNNNLSIFENLKQVSSPETIRRTRQKLCQEGLIKPSEKTTDARYNDYKKNHWNLFGKKF